MSDANDKEGMSEEERYRKPDQASLEAVYKIPVLDQDGKSIAFEQLISKDSKTVLIFIRHFFCGVRLSLPRPTPPPSPSNP